MRERRWVGFARLRGALPVWRPPPGETHMTGSARSPRRHESAVPWMVPVSAPRHHAERRAGKGTPTSGRHSPPQAGGREGPRVGLWFASRPGPASSAQVSRSRACRPEVGVPLRPAPSGPLGFPRGSAFSQQLAAVARRLREWRYAGFAGLRPAVRVSAPGHRAERRAGKGTPTSGRHSPPEAGGREGPRVAPPV